MQLIDSHAHLTSFHKFLKKYNLYRGVVEKVFKKQANLQQEKFKKKFIDTQIKKMVSS